MKKAMLLLMAAALSVVAQNQVSWVASSGSGSACTRSAPCATFAAAALVTNSGGTIRAVDAGDFGAVSFTQPVTLDGEGSGATIAVTAVNGVAVMASSAATPLTVMNLAITLNASGAVGIMSAAGTFVDHVRITGGTFADGIQLTNSGGGSPVSAVHDVQVDGAATDAGLSATGATLSVRESGFRGSAGAGILLASGAVAAVASIEKTELVANATGLMMQAVISGSSTARYHDSVVTGNVTGLSIGSGAQLITFRTNFLAGNGTDGTTPFSSSLK